MKPERAIFEDKEAAEKAADKRALDDIAAGRVIDHAKVAEWLEKWGTPDEKPLPDSWRESVWTREALAHVEAIRIYIGQFDPAAAQRLATRLIDAGNRLRAFPRRGRSVGDGFRQLALIRPYLIRYRIEQDTVYIVGVRHGARRG